MGKITIGLLVLIVTVASLVVASVVVQHYIPSVGTIVSLTYYVEDEYMPTEIDWGPCQPGYTYYFDNMTVVNTGNTPLNVTIIPYGLPVGWSFEWLGNMTLLDPAEKVEAELSLTIPNDAIDWPADCGFYLIGEQT